MSIRADSREKAEEVIDRLSQEICDMRGKFRIVMTPPNSEEENHPRFQNHPEPEKVVIISGMDLNEQADAINVRPVANMKQAMGAFNAKSKICFMSDFTDTSFVATTARLDLLLAARAKTAWRRPIASFFSKIAKRFNRK
jgi:hypothetical protein